MTTMAGNSDDVDKYKSLSENYRTQLGTLKAGDIIILDKTDDKFSGLKSGDKGEIIEFWSDDLRNPDGSRVWRCSVRWFDADGSTLSLLMSVDKFHKITE